MLFELVRVALVALLLVALPGLLLVNATLPPKRSSISRVERAFLAVAGGIFLLSLVGVLLGFLPHEKRGYFQTASTGMPFVEATMALVSAGLFAFGLERGAYPWFATRFPRLLPSRWAGD